MAKETGKIIKESLRPCPFCNGEVALADMGHYWLITRASGMKTATMCKCRVFMESDSFHAHDKEEKQKAKEKVIKAWNTRPNPWHTGNPTEEGDYLVKLDVERHVYPYYVLKWSKGGWYSHYDMDYPACPQHSVLKWQKIVEG